MNLDRHIFAWESELIFKTSYVLGSLKKENLEHIHWEMNLCFHIRRICGS